MFFFRQFFLENQRLRSKNNEIMNTQTIIESAKIYLYQSNNCKWDEIHSGILKLTFDLITNQLIITDRDVILIIFGLDNNNNKIRSHTNIDKSWILDDFEGNSYAIKFKTKTGAVNFERNLPKAFIRKKFDRIDDDANQVEKGERNEKEIEKLVDNISEVLIGEVTEVISKDDGQLIRYGLIIDNHIY